MLAKLIAPWWRTEIGDNGAFEARRIVNGSLGAKLLAFLAWLLVMPILFIWDMVVRFVRGARNG